MPRIEIAIKAVAALNNTPMGFHDSQPVDEGDMRVIVRLLGEVAARQGPLMTKRCHLLDGLCEFAGAGEWRWSLHSRNPTRCLGFLRRQLHAPLVLPADLPEVDHDLRLEDLTPPARSHPTVIVARRFPDAETESRIALYRISSADAFSDRQAFLVSLVLDEIPWLHWRSEKPSLLENLSPRCRQVCDLLLLGLGRKEIAAHADIAPGTVSGYMRQIYRHFGVTSQAELLRRHRGHHRRFP